MPEIPESVRFHFARQAPSPWNWYTKPEFAGCRLHWTPPAENVASYIIFRSSEGLSSDCCEDLLNGMYEDVADRIDVFKQISQLVDDEIHDKNRYLVLAQLENDDIVWVSDVDSEQFTGPVNDEPLTYWSNPFGDSPKIKDPCRLDYATVRVDNFCGFEWDYPSQYPDFLGFELIVCDVPYSPHTGADSDISAFREVLSGERGQHYMLDRFVTAIVDNDSFVNRFWYYALLVRLPESGRVQIPLRHVSEPFESGTPYMNLRPQPTWGVGRERMMAAFAKWKAKVGQMQRSDSVSDLYSTPAAEAISADTGAVLEFFRHAPDLTLNSFIENPKMIGIQFSAKVNDGTEIIAIRSKEELSDAESRQLLQKAHEDRIVNGSDADAFAFVPKNGYMVLVDSDCHNKSNYAFATYDLENDTFAELSHVKDTTIDFIPLQDDTIRWGYPGQVFSNRNMHCLRLEKIPKKNVLTLEFGILDDTNVCRIELYVFDNEPEFSEDNLEDLHSFVESGSPRLGQRYVIDHLCHNIIDDVSRCDATHYYGAASLDMHGNRTSISVFSLGSTEREDTEYLSDVAGVAKSMPDEAGSDAPRDAHDSDQEDSGIRQRPSRRRSRWEDLIEQSSDADDISSDSGYEHIAANADDSGSSSDSDRYSRSSQSAVRSARRFSWDDDDSSSIPSGDHETIQTDEKPEPSETPSSQSSDRYSRSSQSAVRSARRFSWDDDSSIPSGDHETIQTDEKPEPAEAPSSQSCDRYSRSSQSAVRSARRFSWDDDDSSSIPSSDHETVQTDEKPEPAEAPSSQSCDRYSRSSQSAVRSARRFSWDDDDSSSIPSGDHETIQTDEKPEPAEAPSSQSSDRYSRSSQSAVRSARRFSWDDDDSSLPTDNPDDDIRNVDEEIVVDDDEDDVDFDDDENMDMRQLSRDEIVRRGIEYARSPQSKQRPHSRYSWEEVEEEPEESPEEINQIVEDDLPDEIPDAAPLRRSGTANQSAGRSRSRFSWDDDDNDGDNGQQIVEEEIVEQIPDADAAQFSRSSAANQSAGRSRSRFSWDDDDDNDGDNGQQIVEEEIVEQIPDADAAQFSRSSAANQSAGRSRSRFSWDDDNDEPQPQEPQTIEESKPAEDHSLDILDSDDEDTAAIKTIARCRQLLESGDKQSAVDLIQQAQEKYPDNLRLEAFAWNYLDA